MKTNYDTLGSMVRRFWEQVDKTNACWIWTGACTRYGQLTIGRGASKHVEKAHRISFALHNGGINPTLLVCHECDNPICVTPHHLWQGTHKDNADDRQVKGRWRGGGHPGMNKGITRSTETRAKMSAAMRRRWANPAARTKLTASIKKAFF